MKKRLKMLKIGALLYYAVYTAVCLSFMLVLASCSRSAQDRSDSTERIQLSREERFRIAEQYIFDKYGVACQAFWDNDSYLDFGLSRNDRVYDPVALRLSDDPDGSKLKKRAGQEVLSAFNSRYINDEKPFFVVYLNVNHEYDVIGDQYMWYTVYPLFREWMQTQLDLLAPCPTEVSSIHYVHAVEKGRSALEYNGCFAPDFPLISTTAELEDLFPRISFSIDVTAERWKGDYSDTREEWYQFEKKMGEYRFGGYRVKLLYRTADSDEWQSLSLYRRMAEGFVITKNEE